MNACTNKVISTKHKVFPKWKKKKKKKKSEKNQINIIV